MYVQDISTYRSWHGRRSWEHRFNDHGYNGTPFYQLIAGSIANAIDLSHRNMVLVSFINHLVVFAMFAFVIRAAGWRLGLLFVVLFFTNVPDRWLLGSAFLRYMWISGLVIALSLMRLNRYGPAAVLLVLSALVKIFPVFFLAAVGLRAIYGLVRHRKISPQHRQFLLYGLAATIVFGILSVSFGFGLGNWEYFLHQMDLNSGRFATGRIGFLYNFLWPKEVYPEDGIFSYHDRFFALQYPLFLSITADHIRHGIMILIIASILLVNRRMDDVQFTVLLGFTCFFLLFGTVRYYYSGLVGIPLMWFTRHRSQKGWICFAIFLAIAAFGSWLEPVVSEGFLHNTYYTAVFTLYILGAIVFFAARKAVSVHGVSKCAGLDTAGQTETPEARDDTAELEPDGQQT